MSRENGSILGVANTPTISVASGIWSLNAVALAVKQAIWPSGPPDLRLDFDQGTTLDSRITFTRATNGTYFDSAGVLQTAGSGAARFDHRLEGGVWVNKGLLVEEQRTNVNQRSEEIDNAWYAKGSVTITANSTTSPNGTTTADTWTPDNGSTSYLIDPQSAGNFSAASQNQTWSGSFFVKNNGMTTIAADFNFRTSAGGAAAAGGVNINFSGSSVTGLTLIQSSAVITYSEAQDVGNGWWRILFSGYGTAATVARVSLRIRQAATPETGNGTKGVYLWGLQLEQGAFSTSYIKTTSASVTRNADVATMTSTNFSDWYNATEGTVFWQGDLVGVKVGSTRLYSVSDGTNNEYFQGNATNSSGNGFTWDLFDGGTLQAVLNTPDPAVAPSANTTYKHASTYKVNDFAASRDGGTVATDTSGTLPTVNKLSFGTDTNDAGGFLNGHIAKFYYWNTRKPNSFLQTITG